MPSFAAGQRMQACMPQERGYSAAPAEHALSGSNRVAVCGLLSFFTLFVYIFFGGGIDRAPRWFIALLAKPLQVSPGMLEARGSRVLVYRLEQWFWSHPYSKLILLLVLTVSLISFGSVSLFAVSTKGSLYDTMWAAIEGVGLDWSFVGEGEEQVLVRVVSLLIAIGGTLITALLLGIISDALSQKVDELKRGRGAVLECNHYIIIGWSEKVISLIDQLCQGFETSGGTTIVVLSHKSKEEMDEEISNRVRNRRGSTIIVRKGDPMSRADLELISCSHASSIVLLANATRPEQSDARTLRIVLCLMGIFRSVVEEGRECKTNVLAEMCNSDHENLLRMLVDEPRVRTIVSREMIGRFSVQCARYPALTNVLMELLGFAGNEFYLTEYKYSPMLAGYKFHDMQRLFRDAVPCGVRDASGVSKLSPPGDAIVKPGDQIILLAEDETNIDPTFDEHSPQKPAALKESLSHCNKLRHSDDRPRSSFDARALVRATASMRCKRQSEPASRNIVHTSSAKAMLTRPKRFSEAFVFPSKSVGKDEDGAESDGAGGRLSSSTSRRTSLGTDLEDSPRAAAAGGMVAAEGGAGETTRRGAPSCAASPASNDYRDTGAASEGGYRSGRASDAEGETEAAAGAAAARRRERAMVRFTSSTKQRVQAKEQREEGGKLHQQQQQQQQEEAQLLLLSVNEGKEQEHEKQRKHGLQARTREAALSGKLAAVLRAAAAERAVAAERGQLPTACGSASSPRRRGSNKAHAGAALDWLAENTRDGPSNRGTSHAAGSLAFGGLFLFCGWRQDIVGLIKVLDDFVTEDSELWLFSDVPLDTRRNLLVQGGLDVTCGTYCGLRHLKVRFDDPRLFGSSVLKRHLQALYPVQFTAILLLAEEPMVSEDWGSKAAGVTSISGTRSVADIDSHTLSTLVLLRQIQVEDLRAGRLAPLEPLFKDLPPSPSQPAQSQPALSRISSQQAQSQVGHSPSQISFSKAGVEVSSERDEIEGAENTLEAASCEVGSQPSSLTPSDSCALRLGGADVIDQQQQLQQAPPPQQQQQQQQEQLVEEELMQRPLEPKHPSISIPGTPDHAQASVAMPINTAHETCNGVHTPDNAGPRPWLEGCLIENPFFNTPASEEGSSPSTGSSGDELQSNGHVAGQERRWCSSVTRRRLRKAERKQLLLGNADRSARAPLSSHPVTSLPSPSPDLCGPQEPQEDSLCVLVQPLLDLTGTHKASLRVPEQLPQGPGTTPASQPPQIAPLHGPGVQRGCAPQLAQSPNKHPQHQQQQQQQQPSNPAEQMLDVPGSEVLLHGRVYVHANGHMPAQPGIVTPERCQGTTAAGEASHAHRQLALQASPAQGAPPCSASCSKMFKSSPPLLTPSGSMQRSTQPGMHSTTPQGSLQQLHNTSPQGILQRFRSTPPQGSLQRHMARQQQQQQQQQQQHVPALGSHAHMQASFRLPPPKVPPTATLGITVGDAAEPSDPLQTSPSMRRFRKVSRAVLAAGSFKRRPPRHGSPSMNGNVDVPSDESSNDPDLQDDATHPLTPRSGNKWLNDPLMMQAVQRTVIVAELLDGGAHEMLKDMAIAQYMLSNELLSELLALVATCPERADILEGLLQAGGVELYLRPTWWLVEKGEYISFIELSARASTQGEVLVGFIDKSRKSFLNPASKLEPRLSRATVEALVTTAWS